jgi:eukaryotic-like serine/threonine-protein kinase
MTLTGSKLGPYEILGQIGAGGMGEVYRAKDPRLGRDVAIKVLPASFSADADRLRRFEQEARAAGVLNHPNITIVYDIGQHDGAPYVVQELLEGETLRAVLAGGKLSPRKAIDFATQIANGLAAAHERGIVHRDLKPENLFVTRDGRVKILDFGLAKLTHQEEGSQVTNLPTATAGTEPGIVLGTLGYMSPEQVRGRPADARSDIFSFGAILYEMLSGNHAFRGDSAADTMSAILKEDPPDLSVTNQNISPGLEHVVRHCLEKSPEQRFQSARDLAFNLGELSGASGTSVVGAPMARGRRRFSWLALGGVIVPVLVALAFWAGRRSGVQPTKTPSPTVDYTRVTFRRGNVLYARFTADGQTVVYSAAWGDQPAEIFLARVGSPGSRPLGIPGASLLSVSSTGELAILLKKTNLFGTVGTGTLARVPLGGGAPRQILDDAYAADWSPDGSQLAVLRDIESKDVLEFPIGKTLLRSAGGLTSPRISPDGGTVALIDNSESPSIALIDHTGKSRVLSRGWIFADTLAWHPSGREVWVDGVRPDENGNVIQGVFAVDLQGRSRTVTSTVDLEVLHDIAKDGRVLMEREISPRELLFGSSDSKEERNLSWLDQPSVACLSADGKTLLFDEGGEGGGDKGSVFLRTTDGAPAVRLGDGFGQDLSPDGRWALTRSVSNEGRLILLPTGAGEPRPIPLESYRVVGASFLPPDGTRIGFIGSLGGKDNRGYVVDLAGGTPREFLHERISDGAAISPDGKLVAANSADGTPKIYPLDGGEPKPIHGLEVRDVPIQWSADGQSLFVTRRGLVPLPIHRYVLATGKKTLWREIMPADRTGLIRIENVWVARDGRSYAYSLNRVTNSDLYVVTGWK